MLPFRPHMPDKASHIPGDKGRGMFSLYMTMALMQDHQSVSGWSIHTDGSVSIEKACVLASPRKSKELPPRGLGCLLRVAGGLPGIEPINSLTNTDAPDGKGYDLDKAVCALAACKRYIYAVIVKHSLGPHYRVQGILLEEKAVDNIDHHSSDRETKILVKIGLFAGDFTDDFQIPEAESVDWEVL